MLKPFFGTFASAPHHPVCTVLVACLCCTVCLPSLLPRSPHVTVCITFKAVMHHGLLRQVSGMWCMLTAHCCVLSASLVLQMQAHCHGCNMLGLASSRRISIAVRVHCCQRPPVVMHRIVPVRYVLWPRRVATILWANSQAHLLYALY